MNISLSLAKKIKSIPQFKELKSKEGFILDIEDTFFHATPDLSEDWYQKVFLSDYYFDIVAREDMFPAPTYSDVLKLIREQFNVNLVVEPHRGDKTTWGFKIQPFGDCDSSMEDYDSSVDGIIYHEYIFALELGINNILTHFSFENEKSNPFEKLIEWLTPFGILKSSTLEDQVVELLGLDSLDLSYCQLTSIPKEIGELKNLEALHLNDNQLTSIPKEIGELKNLKDLHLDSNQLTSIPKEIGELKNLTYLDLHNNQLTTIPKEIGELKKLKHLYLDHNKFTSIPKEIKDSLPNCSILI